MRSMVKNIIEKIAVKSLKNEILENRCLQGRTLAELQRARGVVSRLSDVEFKVFSQWGDDGIIQYLIRNLDIPHRTFIEFGVETYVEANTRFLLINNNWSGMVIDGTPGNIDIIKSDSTYWRHDLQAEDAFITTENINALLAKSAFPEELGILSIDIDGNDYYVWKSITAMKPIIVIAEYNSAFGNKNPYSTIYDPKFFRTHHHSSNLVYGSSLMSLCDLATDKGYHFVGCNSAGNNAYFVRKDKIGPITVQTLESGYVESKFKESRNPDGSLSYLRGKERNSILNGHPIYNTRTNQIETIKL